ncbi:MAG: helix-turn-helix domain-containing protein [Promethearchaeota archaeon]|jgi:sugar-specific transcriptional regulator TrmB
MIAQLITFLYEIGFSDIQINIYKYLLTHKFGTINEIKSELNYSYTQVYHNLLYLEEKKLIESNSDTKPKLYFRKNPKIVLTELLTEKFESLKENVIKLDDELKAQESKFGRCVKDISFYHYSNINLAVENFYDLIEHAKTEVILTSLPIFLLRKLESSLYEAYMRGIRIKIYFSLLDFENITNYLETITDILRRIRVDIIQTEQKTCQVIRYNDNIVNMGNILIDENYLNSIIFKEDEVYHIDGFRSPVAKEAKGYLEVLTIVKRIEIEYPEPIQEVLDVINENVDIKTRDLSSRSRIGGSKLREILEYLIREGLIEEKVITGEKAGRPKRVYSLTEKNISS